MGNSWQIKYRREPSLPGSVGGTPDGSMSSIYPEDGHTRLRIEGTPNGFESLYLYVPKPITGLVVDTSHGSPCIVFTSNHNPTQRLKCTTCSNSLMCTLNPHLAYYFVYLMGPSCKRLHVTN